MLREKSLEIGIAAMENRFVRAAAFSGLLFAHTSLAAAPTFAQGIKEAQVPKPTPLRIDMTLETLLKKLGIAGLATGFYLTQGLAPAMIQREQGRKRANAVSTTGLVFWGLATAAIDLDTILFFS